MNPYQHLTPLRGFVGTQQAHALLACVEGEEGQHFLDRLAKLAEIIRTMPATYQTDEQGEKAIAWLHYFAGGQADFYITEKDCDPDGEGQVQAFGLADLFGDGGELGYISIPEILENGGELDLYYTPKPLAEIRSAKR